MAATLPDPPAPGDFAGAAEWMRNVRDRQVPRREGEGLREHKKRLTRQSISDTATWMFIREGFDEVRIADVARAAGVSEKTVYNYFPTKESLVFDRAPELLADVVAALRDRPRGVSPVQAVLEMMAADQEPFEDIPDEALWMLQAFDELVTNTPALVSAQRAMTKRLVAAIADVLADQIDVDPRDPEPQVVAQAIVGLWETRETSFSRHIEAGLAGRRLIDAVSADTARAARVLEAGLATFDVVSGTGRANVPSEDLRRRLDASRRQIAAAVRDARTAWRGAR